MLKIRYSILFLLFCLHGFAEKPTELFKGGMFLHGGYLLNSIDFPKINGFCNGIGGKLAFRTGKHLRIGTEGYASSYSYSSNEGFYKLGWGGLLAEYQFSNKRLTPVAGVTVGGGRIRDLYLLAGNYTDNEEDKAIFKVYPTMIIAPHASMEYKLTSHLNLVLKADYLFYPGIENGDMVARGPRLYIGILFSR